MTDDDVLMANAFLALTGQLLSHNASVRAIKGEAELKAQELALRTKEKQNENALSIEKIGAQIALARINDYTKKEDALSAKFEEITGKQFKLAPEEKTQDAPEAYSKHNDDAIGQLQGMRAEAEEMAATKKANIKDIKNEMRSIRPVLEYVKKHYSSAQGGDPWAFEPEDYSETVNMAFKSLGIDQPSEYLTGALNRFEAGNYDSGQLRKLNAQLAQIEGQEEARKHQKNTALASATGWLEREVESIRNAIAPSEQGDDAPLWTEIQEEINTAEKEGKTIWGKKADDNLRGDIVNFMQAKEAAFNLQLKQYPWFEKFIMDKFPGYWPSYLQARQRYDDIAINKALETVKEVSKKDGGGKEDEVKTKVSSTLLEQAIKAYKGD